MYNGMIRNAAIGLMMIGSASAAEQVEVISSIPVAGSGGQIGAGITQILNKVQTDREYKFVVSPGAQGDTSALKALVDAKTQNVVMFNGISVTTTNRLLNLNAGFDRDKDFIQSIGIGKNYYAIMVNPDSPIKNVDDLVKSIKSKPKAFFSTTLTAPGSVIINDIFLKRYALEGKVESINYKSPQEIILALNNKESDYTIFTVSDMTNLKAIMVSADKRLVQFPDAHTAKEDGFNEFSLSSILMFSIPKERAGFQRTFEEDMKKACTHPDYERIANIRAPYRSECMTPADTMATVENELKTIK
jgi:tripartite-type tricarboxylate transporter receptor subunit TctC